MENRRDQNRVKKAELGVHLSGKHSTQEVEAGVVQEFKTSLTYIVSWRQGYETLSQIRKRGTGRTRKKRKERTDPNDLG